MTTKRSGAPFTTVGEALNLLLAVESRSSEARLLAQQIDKTTPSKMTRARNAKLRLPVGSQMC